MNPNWQQANQSWLDATLRVLRHDLESTLRPTATDRSATRAGLVQAEAIARDALDQPPALDVLAESFGLSTFERSLLLLCAAVELDREVAGLVAAGADEHRLTLGLALAALPESSWDALSPVGPLRHWELVTLAEAPSLAQSPVRVDERVLHYLLGTPFVDPRLGGFTPPVDDRDLVPSMRSSVQQVVSWWRSNLESQRNVVVQLLGSASERATCAAAAAAELGLQLVIVGAEAVPTDSVRLEAFIRRCERELLLADCVLMIECDAVDGDDRTGRAALQALCARSIVPLALGWDHHSTIVHGAPTITVELAKPTRLEQADLWRGLLADRPEADDVERIAAQFDFEASHIREIADGVSRLDPAANDERASLWDACRRHARADLHDLAVRLDDDAAWSDLVLPEAPLASLREIVRSVRHGSRVHDEWGFAQRFTRGLGVTAMFSGASGSGKTLAAEVIATELRLDLFAVDLSTVVNRFIGETEKNLRRIFDAAERSGAILFFDEADALFGARSDARGGARGRVQSIGANHLLTRLETHRGLTIMTTNRRDALDQAFVRRMRFVVEFPLPDTKQRRKIWREVFPPQAPLGSLDHDRLAELEASGGMIRNIALNAAFAAADEGGAIEMRHVDAAAQAELEKRGASIEEKFER